MEKYKWTGTEEQLEDWKKILRSGSVRQTTGRLCKLTKHRPKYCCIGVYAEKVLKLPYILNKYKTRRVYIESSNSKIRYLCKERVAGLTWQYIPSNLQGALIKLNDTDRKTFKEIANWLDENVEV